MRARARAGRGRRARVCESQRSRRSDCGFVAPGSFTAADPPRGPSPSLASQPVRSSAPTKGIAPDSRGGPAPTAGGSESGSTGAALASKTLAAGGATSAGGAGGSAGALPHSPAPAGESLERRIVDGLEAQRIAFELRNKKRRQSIMAESYDAASRTARSSGIGGGLGHTIRSIPKGEDDQMLIIESVRASEQASKRGRER